MHKHLYVTYPNDDTRTFEDNENDFTHLHLIDQGYRVIAKEIGYTSTRYEYMKQLSYKLINIIK